MAAINDSTWEAILKLAVQTAIAVDDGEKISAEGEIKFMAGWWRRSNDMAVDEIISIIPLDERIRDFAIEAYARMPVRNPEWSGYTPDQRANALLAALFLARTHRTVEIFAAYKEVIAKASVTPEAKAALKNSSSDSISEITFSPWQEAGIWAVLILTTFAFGVYLQANVPFSDLTRWIQRGLAILLLSAICRAIYRLSRHTRA